MLTARHSPCPASDPGILCGWPEKRMAGSSPAMVRGWVIGNVPHFRPPGGGRGPALVRSGLPTDAKPPRTFLSAGVLRSYRVLKGISVFCRPGSDLLFRVLRRSTIGAGAIYGRVRDGIGYGRPARATRPAKDRGRAHGVFVGANGFRQARCLSWIDVFVWRAWLLARRAGRTLIMRAIKPIERLVPVSCGHCCPSTSGLSTWSSSTVLKGELVLRWVSRLDAFSGYPVHT